MFTTFARRTRETQVVGESLAAVFPGARAFGLGPAATVRGERVELEPDASRFEIAGVRFTLPVPGRHNVENALAAVAACGAISCAASRPHWRPGTGSGCSRCSTPAGPPSATSRPHTS